MYGFNIKKKKQYGLVTGASKKPGLGGVSLDDGDSDDEDDIAASIARESAIKKAKTERERAEKLVEDDPNLYDYDGAYDALQKERKAQKDSQKNAPRESKYISKLKETAEERQEEHERVMERKIQREQEQDAHLYGDKEKFVTRAYKEKLDERKQKDAERAANEKAEEASDSAGRKNMTSFYYNMLNRQQPTDKTKNSDQTLNATDDDDNPAARGKSHSIKNVDASFEDAQHSSQPRRVDSDRPNDVHGSRPGATETQPKAKKETKHERAVRLNRRRNDDAAIEAARQRYFKRVSEKEEEKARVART
uniref:Nuclear speckle splicing regulatory protein 1 N-terminal domain-containing protein n=1 Tax=Rhodosorus marinus TaxID=101924 RepID=A0A7S0BLP2_9RHOD|mmetsp:Transcript_22454/g.32329  ORF Transcript_22454/g.32329 Transcript_22454/m.32329 type:complete len:307 (+) Transcript_22454:59-979(+)|eukprot:CAMPEP_0184749354 /NCGR_PEP_ID=MMETSP0315-20130426/27472_1 /TAXON_ID=101924 /ORGANISM="Rhodosorus marinus, Strain UTEX LB 2760" /LENGTH=306 /DNA_ID=CAMNT_0027226203 /DNA_START=21 /DNA_END=941 /DNA_ORIENTATION=-